MYRAAEDSALRASCPLGQGGTAEVVRAWHLRLKRPVAVKYARTDPEFSPDDFARLIHREYDLIGGYRFPGLVRPLTDPSPDYDHLVLEFCAGPTLDKVGVIDDLGTAMNVIWAAALNLEFLRALGLVHGDLKPHNLFLPERWPSYRADQLFFLKLSDFSLGRRCEEPDNSRLGLGTVGYMAPETVREHRTSHLSDLFALGVTAYQVLTGRHPFIDGETDPVKINGRVREHCPASPDTIRTDVPENLSNLVMQLLSKEDSDRPRSGWQVCEALEHMGARYPFRRALRPAFLMRKGAAYVDVVDSMLRLSEKEKHQLINLTGENPEELRLILSGNFQRDRLHYVDGRFQFSNTIYWPHRSRCRTLQSFSKAAWAVKRIVVRASVLGGLDALVKISPNTALPAPAPSPALAQIMSHFLKMGTVKRLSVRLAPIAYRQDAHELACRLHLQAGNFDEAERCAELAAASLVKESRSPDAIALLLKLDRQARLSFHEYEIRQSLKLKGTIHKDIGELDQAEREYLRVIRLYDKHPVDKLLAETYKHLGEVYRLRQNRDSALEALEKSLAVFRNLGDELEISHTLTNIGNVHWLGNDTRQALTFYLNAYRIQKRLRVKADCASTLHNIASVYCMQGRLKRGIALFHHSLRLKKDIGNLGEIARTLNNLGYAYQLSGSPSKAAEALAESLEINRKIGSKKETLYNIENLIALRFAAGQLSESQSLLDEGLTLARSHNLLAHEGTFHMRQAAISQRRGRYNEALQSLSEVERVLGALADYSLDLLSDVRRASIRRDLGDIEGALTIARRTHDTATQSRNSEVELENLLLLPRLIDEAGYWDAANKIIDERRLHRERRILGFGRLEFLLDRGDTDAVHRMAPALLSELDDPEPDLERAWMLNLAGMVELNRQQRQRAVAHFEAARRLAEEIGLLPELTVSLTMLGQTAKIKGDYEQAFGSFKQALGLCRRIAESIDDPADQKLFLSRPMVQSLAMEIKTLGQKLGNKARADR